MVSEGNLRNSSHVQFLNLSISPMSENVHSASGVRGVGPAESTGKSLTRYWPGGIRPACPLSRGRPWKAREMKFIVQAPRSSAAIHRRYRVDEQLSQHQHAATEAQVAPATILREGLALPVQA